MAQLGLLDGLARQLPGDAFLERPEWSGRIGAGINTPGKHRDAQPRRHAADSGRESGAGVAMQPVRTIITLLQSGAELPAALMKPIGEWEPG